MQVRLLLGPAGSGKTHRCLSEARQMLTGSPEGPPLVLVAPRQGTYQLEQQLLSTPSLAGYTRLSIVSFESLARLVLQSLERPGPSLLSEEGRIMVLRSLLGRQRERLKLYRASARLTGFAAQVNETFKELQRAGLDLERLNKVAAGLGNSPSLQYKLQDLAVLLQAYQQWLREKSLQDQEALLRSASEALKAQPCASVRFEALWVDGFAELTEPELDLLAALVPCCDAATLTFCLDRVPGEKTSWLSHWAPIEGNFVRVRKRLAGVASVSSEVLPRRVAENRFYHEPALQHLEAFWDRPKPFPKTQPLATTNDRHPAAGEGSLATAAAKEAEHTATQPRTPIRLVCCPDPEAEVSLAAREILRFVRTGGRFRHVSVLVRNLESHHRLIQRIFTRYNIPLFLDRRQSVSHHPLAELTRSALRVAAFGWRQEDWFAVLKSGLAPLAEEEIDLLENEALEHGWHGRAWLEPLVLKEVPRSDSDRKRLEDLQARLENIRRRGVPAFEHLANRLAQAGNRPTGPQLAAAFRALWETLGVEERLQAWSIAEAAQEPIARAASVHATVWQQTNEWLDNAELAFANESLSLREWLPVLEAGLGHLTVGIIPPALDQVLVGAVDRSRTPEVEFVLVIGLNEGTFPCPPQTGCLLTEADRLELDKAGVDLGTTARRQLSRESYLAYIACTRARRQLLLTWAAQDAGGAPLNPSSIISRIRELFPGLARESVPPSFDWVAAEHPIELVPALLRPGKLSGPAGEASRLASIPGLAAMVGAMERFNNMSKEGRLSAELAGRLYGPVLQTSVSRIEQFAACPFRFFVHSGLRAEERKRFELDVREQGTFQHDVLALFHQGLRAEGKRWRDITPQQARQRVAQISNGLTATFRAGLLEADHQTRFTARMMTESLQDFVEILVTWMREQYRFDPVEVELPFGEEGAAPAWRIELGEGKRLELHGRIDRIDLYCPPESQNALCVVVDYKSSEKQLDTVLVAHGIQLQLLSYLNVVRQWPNPGAAFGVERIEPAGVFYVSLRGRYGSERTRTAALGDPNGARKLAYRHSGRFDVSALRQLDGRDSADEGDQFNYRLTGQGAVKKNCKEALSRSQFQALLAQTEKNLGRMGREIYSGRAEVGPYRKGQETACDQCSYQPICRVDPWTHQFRVLSAKINGAPADPAAPVADS